MVKAGKHNEFVDLWQIEKGLTNNKPFPFQAIISFLINSSLPIKKRVRGKLVYPPFQRHTVESFAFSPNGESIITGGHDGTVCLWDVYGEWSDQVFFEHQKSVNSVIFSPDGHCIISGSSDRSIKIWNLQGEVIKQIKQKSSVTSVVLSPNGQFIATAGSDKVVYLWNLEGHLIAQIKHEAEIRSVIFSPDNQSILTACSTYINVRRSIDSVRIFNLKGQLIRQLENMYGGEAHCIAFVPKIQQFCFAHYDELSFYNLQGNFLRKIRYGNSKSFHATSLAFNSKNYLFVAGISDGAVLYDYHGRQMVQVRHEQQQEANSYYYPAVKSVAFSPDGQVFATASTDGTIRLWNLEGDLIGQFNHDREVNSVAFSPDGNYIVSGSSDNTVRLWRGNWREWLRVCCDRLRNHNPQEGGVAEEAYNVCKKYVWNEQVDEFNYKQGLQKLEKGDVQGAIKDFNRTILLNPEYVDAFYKRGVAYITLQEYQKAIQDLDEVVHQAADHADSYYSLGLSHSLLGNQHLSTESFKRAAELYQKQGQTDKLQTLNNLVKERTLTQEN